MSSPGPSLQLTERCTLDATQTLLAQLFVHGEVPVDFLKEKNPTQLDG